MDDYTNQILFKDGTLRECLATQRDEFVRNNKADIVTEYVGGFGKHYYIKVVKLDGTLVMFNDFKRFVEYVDNNKGNLQTIKAKDDSKLAR